MTRSFAILVFGLLIFSGGCSSKKKTAALPPPEPPRPSWLMQRPLDPGYYVGIGMALKSPVGEHIQQAKNNALNDLASEISVQVSSSSLLYQMEQDSRFREDFRSDTRTRSKALLEGYELADTWENSREYWVFYRLSRQEYRSLMDRKRSQAMALAKAKLTDAASFSTSGNHLQALTAHIAALQALQDFWSEPMETEWNGRQVFLGNEAFLQLQSCWNNLRIEPRQPVIDVKRGDQPGPVEFILTTSAGTPQEFLPVLAAYSGTRLRNNRFTSDAGGKVNIELPKISSQNPEETVQVMLDVDQIISSTSAGAAVAALLRGLPAPQAIQRIRIAKPKVYLKGSETNLGKPLANHPLQETFRSLLVQEGFDVLSKSTSADLIVEIEAATNESGTNGEFVSSSLTGSIKTYRPDGKLIHSVSLDGVKGVQLSPEQAGLEAYRRGSEEIGKRYFRDWRRQLFD